MGINLNCLRCHDHKFDPFLQTDYYRMMALYRPVFSPDLVFPPEDTRWRPSNVGFGSWPARFIPNATQAKIDRFMELQKVGPTFRDIRAKQSEVKTDWQKKQFATLDEPLRTQLTEIVDLPATDRAEEQVALFDEESAKFPITNDELAELCLELRDLQAKFEQNTALAAAAKPDMVWAAWDVTTDPAATHLLMRGSYEAPGDPVEPGVPVIFDDPSDPFVIPDQAEGACHTGRRLAFAKWLTRPEHPLTARVIANRVWQYHFGEGIVTTPDNFGSQDADPTHPELLDWLAVSLIEHDWSLKWLHRQIVLSNVYRQSSDVAHEKYLLDQPYKLLGRWQTR
jgi:hypothetical protein